MISKAKINDRTKRIVSLLSAEYGDPQLNNQTDPVDELIFILLSEKTDETKYLAAFNRLKKLYKSWKNLLKVPSNEIEDVIKDAGMGKRRSQLLQRMLRAVIDRFGDLDLSALASMSSEDAERELLNLPGIGRKAARCVLLYCFDKPVLPVDVHTYRLSIRLGILTRRVSYEQSHSALQPIIPERHRRAFHVNAVAHGRTRCFANKPRCDGCILRDYCSHPKAVKPISIPIRPKPFTIDLFAGAGGLSTGFKKAGFQIVQAIENDPRAVATYRHNHHEVDILEEDIHNLDPVDCLRRLGLRPGDLTVLIGGPPCQGFSESNRRTRTIGNPKNHLFREFVRFLDVMQPGWFVIENVAGVRSLAKGAILRQIIEDCRNVGYEVAVAELNASEYGVPQFRRRVFIIGNRLKLPIRFPEPTHGPSPKQYVTVRQAISDLPPIKSGASLDYLPYEKNGRHLTRYQIAMRDLKDGLCIVQGNLVTCNSEKIIQRYKHVGPGQNWEAIPPKLLDNYKDFSRCHTGIYHRLEWNKPAKVIGNFRKNMLIHPEQDRGLSVRESARLQSFTDDFEFLGSIGFQQQQVADAVPPLLAEAVARSIRTI